MALHLNEALHSARLRIAPLVETDIADLHAVNGDEAVTRLLPYACWTTPEDGWSWWHRMQALQASGDALQLVLHETAAGDRAIGTCLLFRHDAGSARAELGYALGRAHWGQGLMAEALRCLIAQAFGPLGLRRLEAEVRPDNTASLRLLQALKFQPEGVARQRWVTKGQAHDVLRWGLLASDPQP